MAREYNPDDDVIVLDIKRVRRAGSRFYAAVCKKCGEVDTAPTEQTAAQILGDHMGRHHPGKKMRLQT